MDLSSIFSTAAIALAVDLLFIFPFSHTSLIGQAITAFSGSVIVPPLDWLATDIFGMVNPADALTDPSTAFASASTGGGASTALSASPDAVFSENLAGATSGDQPVVNPFE